MVKKLFRVNYEINLFNPKNKTISGSKEDLIYLADSKDEVKKLLKRDILKLFKKSEKPKLKILSITKPVGIMKSSQVFNVPNNINLKDLI